MNKGRVGEERRGKETDGCPLTGPVLVGETNDKEVVNPLQNPAEACCLV
jgi:hypothetical protein